MKKSFLVITMLLVVLGNDLLAQDLIYKKNNEVIECKVVEVETKIIKYTQEKYNNGILSIDKSEVRKIVYESGEELVFPVVKYTATTSNQREVSTDKKYQLQRKSILKFEFFSPLMGALSFGYERSLGRGRSFDMGFGIIGIGTKVHYEASGGFLRLGYKIIRDPDIYETYGSGGHILKGAFVRPDISISYFNYKDPVYSANPNSQLISQEAYSVAFTVSAGKQWVINDSFSVSWSAGIGYAFSSEEGYYYSHITGGNEFPIAARLNLSIGFLP